MTCVCGKPAGHVNAPEGSDEWACRIIPKNARGETLLQTWERYGDIVRADNQAHAARVAARCPTEGVCPCCREGIGHWRTEDGECVDCHVTGHHFCQWFGAAREAMASD